MPPRANWKGYLRLSLVSCPIALYSASSLSEKVSFNRLNRKTGNRLKQQNVDSCLRKTLRAAPAYSDAMSTSHSCFNEAISTQKLPNTGGNISPMMLNLNGQH